MNNTLIESIRTLRKRDGRTQEELAKSLGVTPQAVSRWESGGGYPDIDLLPSIANYFHITIDELFGYKSDREEKINSYVSTAKKLIEEKPEEAEQLLRNALSEFPSSAALLVMLATVLYAKNLGISSYYDVFRSNPKNELFEKYLSGYSDMRLLQVENARKEAASLCERALAGNDTLTDGIKSSAVNLLSELYSAQGQYEKLRSLAANCSAVCASREVVLAKIPAQKGENYSGICITALFKSLLVSVCAAVKNAEMADEKKLTVLKSLADCVAAIYDDGNLGDINALMGNLYNSCACFSRENSEKEKYYGLLLASAEALRSSENSGNATYTAPLVNTVPFKGGGIDIKKTVASIIKLLPEVQGLINDTTDESVNAEKELAAYPNMCEMLKIMNTSNDKSE